MRKVNSGLRIVGKKLFEDWTWTVIYWHVFYLEDSERDITEMIIEGYFCSW